MSCEKIVKKLPLIPGYQFLDVTKSNFHKSQCFDYKLGVPSAKNYVPGSGNSARDIDSMGHIEWGPSFSRIDPELIYGEPKKKDIRPFRPHFVQYDRTCLRLRGYFHQPAFNTPYEKYRIRVVDVLYFLEDDTVTVIEPQTPNSGLPQGRLVRRSRIPRGPPPDCEYLHWKDLNIGQHVRLCGFLVYLVDCDTFTREFLLSQGVEVNPTEDIPMDEFTRRQLQEPECRPRRPATANPELKLRQFLQCDGIVLKFRALWENEGDSSAYCVSYFMADDTIQVAEIHDKNSGKDPFPILLKRTKLPRNWEKVELTYPSITEQVAQEVTEFYQPKDLVLGQKITVYGREMLLHQCDNFTRSYYDKVFHITQPENFVVAKPKIKALPKEVPPYTGFGSLEDSLQSCLSFSLKPPKEDIVRKIVNANQFLRYKAKLKSVHPEDQDREFVISYSLADGTVSIMEPPRRNSGHIGGKFLASMKIPKPGSSPSFPEYYTPHDFYIGSQVVVNDFRFIITGADLHVYNYMTENAEKFRPEVVDSIKEYVKTAGLIEN